MNLRTLAEDRKAARRSAGFSPRPQLLRLSMRNLLSVHGRSNLHPATNKYSLHRPGREHVVLSKLSEQAGNLHCRPVTHVASRLRRPVLVAALLLAIELKLL